MLSPVLTPLILLFWVKPRASEFIDFFHNFTVSVEGIGDVCSFATLDVKKHGDPIVSVFYLIDSNDKTS